MVCVKSFAKFPEEETRKIKFVVCANDVHFFPFFLGGWGRRTHFLNGVEWGRAVVCAIHHGLLTWWGDCVRESINAPPLRRLFVRMVVAAICAFIKNCIIRIIHLLGKLDNVDHFFSASLIQPLLYLIADREILNCCFLPVDSALRIFP